MTKLKVLEAAKLYLEMRGYEILEQNWRRSASVIDTVAQKGGKIYFVNIVYSPDSSKQSDKVEVLTESDQNKKITAAERWLEDEKLRIPYNLATITIGDPHFNVLSFNDNLF
ncbi:MAG: YraN family protein [Candidatus Saccharimonadales bacterium]